MESLKDKAPQDKAPQDKAPQDKNLDIGEVVRQTGVPATTLHVWEAKGVLEPVGRSGLRRQYRPDTVERIAVILLCQRSGFTLAEIARVLQPDAFEEGKTLLVGKLADLRQRRNELDRAIDGIEHALACDHASPLNCPSFLSKLPRVLPVHQQNAGKGRA